MYLDLFFLSIVLFFVSVLLCVYLLYGSIKDFIKKVRRNSRTERHDCIKIFCVSIFVTLASDILFIVLLAEKETRSDIYVVLKILVG